ncbi:TPA: hypothetical protein DIC20_01425 [Candidatus Dependentiae bacterium]|nr:MAG: Thiol-disulfide isomerase and thioredoxin [candidate division TM6 bacterium GW2011_GWF2_36_131]KKQ03540.1 MAG: Thiol-disulfide isomerase and thioredoxin [candidate division TM6 bacterium GW2011_GWE2_36_25]KKQ20185.1 MAG: Thiol-disulfide isomerase and thioredoxin [candidate division TM6 bacterium GW2011_GWA2_36_9]HBR70726.1 hypothetical protein [Candidatus Dependentiae bacterium]HCU00346.1 hypothetical protein [Candidatus Dependentiae bacterium]
MFLKRSFFVLVITSTQLYADLMEINNLKQFNEKIKTGVSVVKFYMDGCAPCKASTPMFTDLSQNNDYKEINFITVNFNRGKAIALRYARMFPTFAFFKDGKLTGNKIVGYESNTKNEMISRIDALNNKKTTDTNKNNIIKRKIASEIADLKNQQVKAHSVEENNIQSI